MPGEPVAFHVIFKLGRPKEQTVLFNLKGERVKKNKLGSVLFLIPALRSIKKWYTQHMFKHETTPFK